MTIFTCHYLPRFALFVGIALGTAPETHAAKAGFAERDITPDIGMEHAGRIHEGLSSDTARSV